MSEIVSIHPVLEKALEDRRKQCYEVGMKAYQQLMDTMTGWDTAFLMQSAYEIADSEKERTTGYNIFLQALSLIDAELAEEVHRNIINGDIPDMTVREEL